MTYKVILSGRLEFGNARSCEKAMQLFQNRFDIIYRTDVFLKLEEVFQVEHSCLDVYRFSAQVTEKTWNNTTKLLEEVTHFAIAGKLDAWLTENGQVLQYCVIEPHTEKRLCGHSCTGGISSMTGEGIGGHRLFERSHRKIRAPRPRL
jgi:hypothetical protein